MNNGINENKDIELRTIDANLLNSVRDHNPANLKKAVTDHKNDVVVFEKASQTTKPAQTTAATQTEASSPLANTLLWAINNKYCQKAAAGLAGLYAVYAVIDYVGVPALTVSALVLGSTSFLAYQNVPMFKDKVDQTVRDAVHSCVPPQYRPF